MMKKYIKLICLILAFAVLIAGAVILYNKLEGEMTGGDVAQSVEKAPGFTVEDYDGNIVSLNDFAGKPIVLNIWASWCPPCKAEMPDFEAAYKKYGDEVVFLMVNATGGQETVASAKSFIGNSGYTFPVYFDTAYEVSYAYQATSIPKTFFIDRDGNLVAHAPGALSGEALEKGINMIK